MSERAWTEATLVDRHEWAPGLCTLRLDLALDFEPGQFVNLGLMLGEQRKKRAYSVASAPGAPAEFYVVEVEQGTLTPHLLSLPLGEGLWIQPQPAGFFTLGEIAEGAATLWMVASGTGLGPYISMLRHGAVFDRFEHVVVVHGVRFAADLGYRDELQAMPRVRYLPCVSREAAEDALEGRITTALEDGRLEARANRSLEPADSHVMLCGNPGLVKEMQALLEARGLERNRRRRPGQITVERYW